MRTMTKMNVAMISETAEPVMPPAKSVCMFLSDYSGWLLGCGATCIRLEKNVQRIARTYGKRAEITITPRHVHISMIAADSSETFTTIAPVRRVPVSFNTITRLSRLSWEIADSHLSLEEASERFDDIVCDDRQNKWLVLVLVSLANASFCRLFGGDGAAMAIVGIATMAGYYLKQCMMEARVDLRLVMLACAFVSSVLGATDYLFSVGTTPQIAIGTSILYLVPGIPYLNSFSDMLNRYYICSFSRFMDAVVLTGCLSIGLCCGMMMMKIGMF